jgi:hypothetical protein
LNTDQPTGERSNEYNPNLTQTLVAEAADLCRSFGFAAGHVVLIGGLVPGLLVPVLDPDLRPHVGTADIDLCLTTWCAIGDGACWPGGLAGR